MAFGTGWCELLLSFEEKDIVKRIHLEQFNLSSWTFIFGKSLKIPLKEKRKKGAALVHR